MRSSPLPLGALAASLLAVTPIAAQFVRDADLPKSEWGVPSEPPPETLVIDVNRAAKLQLDGEDVDWAQLIERLSAHVAKPGNRGKPEGPGGRRYSDVPVLIRAHRDAPAAAVAAVLDACSQRDIGLWKRQIGTQNTELLPFYQSKFEPTPGHTLSIVSSKQPEPLADITTHLAGLVKNPIWHMPARDKPDATEPRPIRVVASGEVEFQAVIDALGAGFTDIEFAAKRTPQQEALWKAEQNLAVLANASSRKAALAFRVKNFEDPGVWNSAVGSSRTTNRAVGGRSGGRRMLARRGGKAAAEGIENALDWLAANQSSKGHWETAEGERALVGDEPIGKVGVTALAVLAMVGDGSTMRSGRYRTAVRNATAWLREQQDPSNGRFGDCSNLEQSIATTAMVEVFGLSAYKILKMNATLAAQRVSAIEPNPNPTVDAWRLQALRAAKDFKLGVDTSSLDKVDPPADSSDKSVEATTANLFRTIWRGNTPSADDPNVGHIIAACPSPKAKKLTLDPITWYYGSFALYQVGGNAWRSWSRALIRILPNTQTKGGSNIGSWKPMKHEGMRSCRVYTTATLCLALESFYRFSQLNRRR